MPEPSNGQVRHIQALEVADILQVSKQTVSRWAKEGKLPFIRTLGGHRRFPEAEIRALAATLVFTPEADQANQEEE
jgi:excisionase family DNA binding protein